MRPSLTISILIGILLGTMLFPMIMIPVMGIGVVIAALFLLVRDVVMPLFHSHNHEQAQ
jgi:Na+-transporting methylmalonyl-CoA/oxaloacetate decarboxylase gamma subunit